MFAFSSTPRRAAMLTLLTIGAVTAASAAEWPDRPVTLIVPFAAGGNTDNMARVTAKACDSSIRHYAGITGEWK